MAAELNAVQNALAAEHAAVYGYGVVGAHLNGAARQGALDAFDSHRYRRDQLRQLVIAAGGDPVAAEPAYQLPFPVRDARAAVALASHLESAAAGAYAELVAAATGADRRFAAQALQGAAVRAARWGGTSTAFPGLPNRSPTPTPSPR
jgi:hypothetical protein